MKISLYNLINVLAIEDKLSAQKLPIKVTYRLSKIFSCAHEEANFYQEKLLEILKTMVKKIVMEKSLPLKMEMFQFKKIR